MNVVNKRALGSSRDTDGGHKTTIAIHAIAELTAGEFVSMILNTIWYLCILGIFHMRMYALLLLQHTCLFL